MRLNLSQKIITNISLITVVVIILISSISYYYAQSIVKNDVDTRLSNISYSRVSYINQFLTYRISEIETSVKSMHVKSELTNLLNGAKGNSKAESMSFLMDGMINTSDLIDISVLNNDGVVIASNNTNEEGKIKSNELYFNEAKENTYIKSFIYDITFKKIVIVISAPIKDESGVTIGVLVEKIDTFNINKLLSDRLGLGKTGETFLVNSVNVVINDLLKENDAALKKILYLPQINLCLNKTSHHYSGVDYKGDKVFGYAYWFPLTESCLVTKINQSEVIKPFLDLIPQAVALIVIILILTLILAFFLGQSITEPISILRNQALKIKDGDLDVSIEPTSNDEIGDMALVLKDMLSKLKELYTNLENKVSERTHRLEVTEKNLEKNLELSEINNKMMIGREIEMVKLKDKIKELEEKAKNDVDN